MKQRLNFAIFVFFFWIFIVNPVVVLATLGVGVGTGKIIFDQPLKMGGIYGFPPLTVINTGDEGSNYEVSVEYKGDQTEISPPKEWIKFEPEIFYLDPGQSQVVEVQTNIPIKTVPGDYFAYLAAHPTIKNQTAGGTTIGISAATKLYFSIAPANFLQGIYYRIVSLIKNNTPWSYIVLIVIFMSILVKLFQRYFSFDIGIRRKSAIKQEFEKE